jgi:hypothetical protein
MSEIKGCADHGCWVKKPEGMGTNSRCRCFRQFGPGQSLTIEDNILLRKLLRDRLALVEERKASRMELDSFHDMVALCLDAAERLESVSRSYAMATSSHVSGSDIEMVRRLRDVRRQ